MKDEIVDKTIKITEKILNQKDNETIIERVTIADKAGSRTKIVSEIRRIKEKKVISEDMAERLKIKKFGICQDQPRGYLEAGIVMHQKEEVRIVDRFNNIERDMKEKLKDSINRKKEHILKEMIEKKKSEQEERLRKMYGNVDSKKIVRRTYNNENTIKVQGYPPSFVREDLERLFIVFGEIKKINIPVDPITGKNKPFAYIDFKQSISVNEAISKMDDYAVGVCVLSVTRPPPQKN